MLVFIPTPIFFEWAVLPIVEIVATLSVTFTVSFDMFLQTPLKEKFGLTQIAFELFDHVIFLKMFF